MTVSFKALERLKRKQLLQLITVTSGLRVGQVWKTTKVQTAPRRAPSPCACPLSRLLTPGGRTGVPASAGVCQLRPDTLYGN